jgi:beta-lactamase superfamily II metal-dependent hydrolase
VVVVVQYGVFKVVFGGDLEAQGWKNLLRNPNFVADIQSTAIFVASHHGRDSGCCTELFDVMRPEIVIISDDEHKYDSQDTGDWYRTRCRGIPVLQNPPERRYVMTTRKDGAMQIDVGPDGRWHINTVPVTDWPRNSGSFTSATGLTGLAANSLGLATGLEPSLSSLMRFGR